MIKYCFFVESLILGNFWINCINVDVSQGSSLLLFHEMWRIMRVLQSCAYVLPVGLMRKKGYTYGKLTKDVVRILMGMEYL